MKVPSLPQIKPWIIEAVLIIFIIAVAAIFRFWEIDRVPAGLHYDEAIDLRQGLRILDGDLYLYTEEGWGREALYYYLVATSLALISDNVIALRATVAICSLGVAITSYFLARRFSDVMTAWLTVAWFAVLYWSVFASRFAVRGITLPLLLGLSALSFLRALESDKRSSSRMIITWAIPGVFLGLAMYTYQPARFVPGLFLLFSAYLWLFHRDDFITKWRGLLIAAAASILVSIPLITILLANPELEGGREWTIVPLTEFLSGHPSQLLNNIVATAKMFTFSGDPLIADNIPFRPIFAPGWTSIFFYAGLLIALFRWRKPAFAFVLLWLVVSLLPTIVTTSAPNFNRLIAALFPITFLAALPVSVTHSFVKQKWGRWPAYVPPALAIIAISVTAIYTWQDYFNNWPQIREDDFNVQFNVAIEEMADRLEHQVDAEVVLINSRNLEDSHPYILDATDDRRSTPVRWVDTAQAIVRPDGASSALLFLADHRWTGEHLARFLNLAGEPVESLEHFAVYDINYDNWPAATSEPLFYLPDEQSPASGEIFSEIIPPVLFGDGIHLSGIYEQQTELIPGTRYTFFSRWDIVQDGIPTPLASFVHLVDEHGNLVAQQDGLGFPPHSWKEGDSFVQAHSLEIPLSLPAGTYYLQLGLYDRNSGQRWQIAIDSTPVGDRLLLPEVYVR